MFTGCKPRVQVTDLGQGYEQVTYVRNNFPEPDSHKITLQFRNAEGRLVMVWPSLMSAEVIKDGVAVFVAHRTVTLTKQDGKWPQGSRLIAVKAPEIPLDITEEVLRRWAQESGADVAKVLTDPGPIGPKEKDGNIEIDFEFSDRPATTISLNSNQLSSIMREVKDKGVLHKDPQWNLNYIETQFKTEVPK
jgi:hypothetical protein